MQFKYLFFISLLTCKLPLFSNFKIPESEKKSFESENYFVPKSYISRTQYCPDNHTQGDEDKPQTEVYLHALAIAKKMGAKNIADVGCGSAIKLLKYFGQYDTIGFEIEPNFQALEAKYPARKWYYGDFSLLPSIPSQDVVICADVIEHLLNPDDLLNWLYHLDFKVLILSTPDKALLPRYQKPPERSQTGPPINIHHIREWSFSELRKYVENYFEIVEHFHPKIEWMCQIMVLKKKPILPNQDH